MDTHERRNKSESSRPQLDRTHLVAGAAPATPAVGVVALGHVPVAALHVGQARVAAAAHARAQPRARLPGIHRSRCLSRCLGALCDLEDERSERGQKQNARNKGRFSLGLLTRRFSRCGDGRLLLGGDESTSQK
jgi:hypothetical protein